jgi:cation:H+ antiporter
MTFATIAFLILGLVLLVVSADWLVKGASRLAAIFGISPLVIGLTVVAFGTSAPELAVSVMSAFSGKADLAIGNVVGSNIFNILFILGIAAIITPLIVHQQLVRIDVPVMIVVSFMLLALGYDGNVSRWDGFLLFGGALVYTGFLVRLSRREKDAAVVSEYEKEFGVPQGKAASWVVNLGLVIVGIGGLVLGSKLLVDSAVTIAQHFGVSELIIGLTIVSIGTSLPEVATSVVAAIRGERDIAVGNLVGSNIFNILSVVGLSSIVAPSGIQVAATALAFDIPVMIAIAVACLPVFFAGYEVTRLNGAVFFTFYLIYVFYLFFASTQHAALPSYQQALTYIVAPVTVIWLACATWKGFRRPAEPR